MRCLGEVEHKDLVGDRSTVSDWQLHLLLVLETLGSNHRVHAHHLRFLVRHFDTDRAFTRHRCDDTDTRCGKRHHDVVFQTLDLGNPDTGLRYDFV